MNGERTLEGYIDEVASAAPAPGAGSVTGVIGALSAALGQMVLNFTDAPDGEETKRRDELLAALRACQSRLMQGADEDEVAYQGYRNAADLPRGTAEEKA